MAYKISKEEMAEELAKGKTVAQIGREYGISHSMIDYISHKYNLKSKFTKHVEERREDNRFVEITSKELAYTVGFLLGDGSMFQNNKDYIEVSQCIADKDVIEWMGEFLHTRPTYKYEFSERSKGTPVIRLRTKINYISKYLGDGLKVSRGFPSVCEEFEPYLLRGLFDADGHIVGGIRQDRGNFFCTVGFSHHKKCLEGVQKLILDRLGISVKVAQRKPPRTDYKISVGSFKNSFIIMDYMYADTEFMPFHRKYNKYKELLAIRKNYCLNSEKLKYVPGI